MSIYLGVDPGQRGSLCFLDTDSRRIKFVPTPCLECNAKQVRAITMAMHKRYGIHMIGLEKVHAIFGTSAGSNFKFGYNVGAINALMETTGIGIDLITPKTWQKGIGIVSQKPPRKPPQLKKAIAAVALRLYPNASILGPRGGILDGRSDALMIAHYLALKYGGLK